MNGEPVMSNIIPVIIESVIKSSEITDQRITPMAIALDQPVFTENSLNVGHHQFIGEQRVMTTEWEQSMDPDQTTIESEGTNVIINCNNLFTEQPLNVGHKFTTDERDFEQMITPDLWMASDQPMFTEVPLNVGHHQFYCEQQQNTENQMITDDQMIIDDQIIMDKQINVDQSTITTTEPFIPDRMIDGMIAFEDYVSIL